ncbi:flavin reductase family protein [Novosphingobium cyanobacteriorum]|uniref:Flavin reductase family protein n=1 Tax=Novosphingobium cyanobacteriorum TaxID=3024215 RepID=A0ABT6CCN6_9SPHN|nr:flavin reductase family protein [Novosphingobium cyanobacteriorum]MDF8331572.1 flavin reductase family protein [Novosphingobium cyanobacteriorum]
MIDSAHFRSVLGAYPTGVSVITAANPAGERHGLVVGSFTSISLDPPLVGFFPDKRSRSWSFIESVGRFCVNVLGADQLELCRRFASRADDKFAELAHGHTPSGQPLLENAIAWIDCSIDKVVDVGDHWLVVGAVEALDKRADGTPLMFFRGQYHDLANLAD